MTSLNNELIPLTVTQLNQQVRSWLELEIGELQVLGELSNLTRPASGHLYFTLKDQGAQLRCVFFRNNQTFESKLLKDGEQVIAQGKLSLYEARGDYQLIVQKLVKSGVGELYQQFEQLKNKLEQQGLFAAHLKRPIKRFPRAIGIITSPSGAAIRDILSTLARRFPIAEVTVYPSEVQGKNAAGQLIKAIRQANLEAKVEVILLARGGGSIEDLWPFNDEQLAFAIRQSTIPIVSGVGHETDFTIADFVADLRAATPTAAAEAVTPDKAELLHLISCLENRLLVAIQRNLQHHRMLLSHKMAALTSPEQRLAQQWQTVDYLERQLHQQVKHRLHTYRHHLHDYSALLLAKNPNRQVHHSKLEIQHLKQQLTNCLTQKIDQLKQHLIHQLATLHAVSPLATLDRGYAIATIKKKILVNTSQINIGDQIKLHLAQGKLLCSVLEKEEA